MAADCDRVLEKIQFRNQFFKAIKGRGIIETPDLSLDVDIAAVDPAFLRLELSGPLGIRFALLVVNDRWTSLYIPRDSVIHRVPTSEFKGENSARAQYFLRQFPFDFRPEMLIPALLSRVNLKNSPEAKCTRIKCVPILEKKVLNVENTCQLLEPRVRFQNLWEMHPNLGYPLSWQSGPAAPRKQAQEKKDEVTAVGSEGSVEKQPVDRVDYTAWMGSGVSSLPTELVVTLKSGQKVDFSWVDAEKWEVPDLSIFDFKPPAKVMVKDY